MGRWRSGRSVDVVGLWEGDCVLTRSQMMYLALTYDHRLLDGREAVTFLVKIKEYIEDPRKMLL